MAKTYRPYVPEQDLLLPPSLRELLPEDHLTFFVSDLIDQLDLRAISNVYEDEERGYPPYHPVMLTKVLVYAYCIGVFSSRKIQRRLVEDVAFRVLAAGNQPDFRTIADFRKTHLAALRGAAAVLAARSEPPGARIRRRPTSAWVLLRSMAPELAEWASFFAASARKRAAAEAGSPGSVTDQDAEDLVYSVETFLAVVETTLGLPVRPTLRVARAG